jgi:hypothetical protein
MAKYGKKAQQKVERAMSERKRGTLRSGGSGRKVTSRKQAIAIGLSEARRAGAKVPTKKASTGRKRKSSGRKTTSASKASGSRKAAGSRKTSSRQKTSGARKGGTRTRARARKSKR